MSPEFAEAEQAAREAGVALRGGFGLDPAEIEGMRTILLFGVVGAEQWSAFAASPEAADGRPDPLDRWSRRLLEALGRRLGAKPLFPFEGPPYWPFQAWAQRAEPVFSSPLGVLIHPRYGLSHAYRGALAFAEALDLPPRGEATSPCLTCSEKPCLTACPVGAFTAVGYAVETCAAHLRAPEGAACHDGCLARRACPAGSDYAQSLPQRRFHMAAFMAARRR